MFKTERNNDKLLKERLCSSRGKFFPVRVDRNLEELRPQGSNREVIKVTADKA